MPSSDLSSSLSSGHAVGSRHPAVSTLIWNAMPSNFRPVDAGSQDSERSGRAALGCHGMPSSAVDPHHPTDPCFAPCARSKRVPLCTYACPCRHTLERIQVNRAVVCRQTDITPGSISFRHRPPAAHRKVEASCCLEHATRQLPDHSD